MKDTKSKINSLPLIDISKFFKGSLKEKKEIADRVAKACQQVGFLLISGHGISESQLNDLQNEGACIHRGTQ